MPSRLAISPIGRIVAAWAISISDWGFLCWSAPRATSGLLAIAILLIQGLSLCGRASATAAAPHPIDRLAHIWQKTGIAAPLGDRVAAAIEFPLIAYNRRS